MSGSERHLPSTRGHGPSGRLWTAHRVLCSSRALVPTVLGLFTVGYFAATSYLASMNAFSFDELTTYYIARLSSTRDVWTAWKESGDGMPPLVHFATHLAGTTLGFSHIITRLPAMVGFWLMCLSIFAFLQRRVCLMLAVVGMLL